MRAGLNKLLIAALVLVSSLISFSAISLADDPLGMWHSASEIGPGTFKDGNYAFGLSNINFGWGTNLTGNASIKSNVFTVVPGQYSNPDTTYAHELRFPGPPSLSYGLSLASNGTALLVNSTGGAIAAEFKSQSASTIYVRNENYKNGGIAIYSLGSISIQGDIKTPANKKYDLGEYTRRWNATYTEWLCLGTPPICKNVWPTGGGPGGTTPNLQEVTDIEAVTTHDITTGGLTLMTGKVIHSQDGNVIIRLGTS
jgi:hypothetical protein